MRASEREIERSIANRLDGLTYAATDSRTYASGQAAPYMHVAHCAPPVGHSAPAGRAANIIYRRADAYYDFGA